MTPANAGAALHQHDASLEAPRTAMAESSAGVGLASDSPRHLPGALTRFIGNDVTLTSAEPLSANSRNHGRADGNGGADGRPPRQVRR